MFNPLDMIGSIWQIPFVAFWFIVAEHFIIVECKGGYPAIIAQLAFAVLYAHHYAKTHPQELDGVG